MLIFSSGWGCAMNLLSIAQRRICLISILITIWHVWFFDENNI